MARTVESGVSVRVGVRRPATAALAVPRVCVLAVGPRTPQWLSDIYPGAVVRAPDRDARGAVVEHLRFGHRQDLRGLPGLGGRHPSLAQDTVAMALAAGATSVDLLLARVPGARPWSVATPEVLDVLQGPLSTLSGVLVLVPDARGPAPVLNGTPADPGLAARNITAVAAALGPTLREAWQVALLDMPVGADEDDLLPSALGQDVALFAWAGSAAALGRQGWRSAAAAVAGTLARRDDVVFHGKTGQTMVLGPGRTVRCAASLPLARSLPAGAHVNGLMLDENGSEATILGESTLRAPLGEWDLAALRTVKLIHRRVRLAAEEFVFRPVTSSESLALVAALDIVLRPFVQSGLLTGPSGTGSPAISGSLDPDPSKPSLIAELSAAVRPWARHLRVRVGVDPGVSATVEVRA